MYGNPDSAGIDDDGSVGNGVIGSNNIVMLVEVLVVGVVVEIVVVHIVIEIEFFLSSCLPGGRKGSSDSPPSLPPPSTHSSFHLLSFVYTLFSLLSVLTPPLLHPHSSIPLHPVLIPPYTSPLYSLVPTFPCTHSYPFSTSCILPTPTLSLLTSIIPPSLPLPLLAFLTPFIPTPNLSYL